MDIQEIIMQARIKCDADMTISEDDWADAVEAEIYNLSANDEIASRAIAKLNRQIFGSAGLI